MRWRRHLEAMSTHWVLHVCSLHWVLAGSVVPQRQDNFKPNLIILLSRLQVQSTFYGLAQLRDGPDQGNRDENIGQQGPKEEI